MALGPPFAHKAGRDQVPKLKQEVTAESVPGNLAFLPRSQVQSSALSSLSGGGDTIQAFGPRQVGKHSPFTMIEDLGQASPGAHMQVSSLKHPSKLFTACIKAQLGRNNLVCQSGTGPQSVLKTRTCHKSQLQLEVNLKIKITVVRFPHFPRG